MAGDWIKLELDTFDKPEVRMMARDLGIDRDAVVGKIARVWGYFNRTSVDGAVDGLVDADVDDIARIPRFAAAMRKVGWLTLDETRGALVLPNFDRHNSQSAKKRALSAAAQAKWRANSNGAVDGHVDGDVDRPASPEKRREEVTTKEGVSIETPSLSTAAPTTVQDGGTLNLTPPGEKVNGKHHPRIPDCPHDKVIDLFKAAFPSLRHPLSWNDQRAANLRARWREAAAGGHAWSKRGFTTEEEGLAFFRRAFAWMAESEALRNGIPRANNNGRWQMDLPWLVKSENWLKVLEGKFHE